MKNNKWYSIIGVFSLLALSFGHKNFTNCEKVKNGKFYYYTKKTREKINIERLDSLQMEANADGGRVLFKSRIIWKGDCNYDMYINALSTTKLNSPDSLIAATPSHVEIIYVGSAFYICIVKMNVFDTNVQLRDTIYFKK